MADSALHRKISERMFDMEARLAKVIFLPAAHDGERAIEDLEEFIEDDFHDDKTAQEFERVWPGFQELRDNCIDDDEDDRDFRRAMVLDLLQTQCPVPFLVLGEFTIKEYVGRKAGDEYPYGTWRGGWSYYTQRWMLAATVEDACERLLALAEEQKRKAWDAYEDKGPASKVRKAKARKGRAVKS